MKSWIENKTLYLSYVVVEIVLFIGGVFWLLKSIYEHVSPEHVLGMSLLLLMVVISYGMGGYRHRLGLDIAWDIVQDWQDQEREMEREVLLK